MLPTMLAKDRDRYKLSMRTSAGPSGFSLPCTQVASNLETIEKLIRRLAGLGKDHPRNVVINLENHLEGAWRLPLC